MTKGVLTLHRWYSTIVIEATGKSVTYSERDLFIFSKWLDKYICPLWTPLEHCSWYGQITPAPYRDYIPLWIEITKDIALDVHQRRQTSVIQGWACDLCLKVACLSSLWAPMGLRDVYLKVAIYSLMAISFFLLLHIWIFHPLSFLFFSLYGNKAQPCSFHLLISPSHTLTISPDPISTVFSWSYPSGYTLLIILLAPSPLSPFSLSHALFNPSPNCFVLNKKIVSFQYTRLGYSLHCLPLFPLPLHAWGPLRRHHLIFLVS